MVLDEFEEAGGEECGRIGGIEEETGDAIADGVARAAGAERSDRETGGHGFEDDVAEGFGEAGEGEEVAGGVVIGEVLAGAVAGEDGVWAELFFEVGAGGTVTDDEDAESGVGLGGALEGVCEVCDVFFGGDSGDVSDDDVLGFEAAGGADAGAAGPVGAEELGVDAAGPEDEVFEAAGLEVGDGGIGGDVGFEGAVMEPPEVAPDGAGEGADAVVCGVLIEVGVKGGDGGDAAAARPAEDGEAECGFGRDMDEVGLEAGDGALGAPEGRDGEKEFLVEGHDEGADDVAVGILEVFAVIRVDDEDVIARIAEDADEFSEGPGDAVDLGEVGFGDEGDAHGRGSAWGNGFGITSIRERSAWIQARNGGSEAVVAERGRGIDCAWGFGDATGTGMREE